MERIPPILINALNELGLSTYEASVYAALVLYDNAEAKEIIDFLAISKPSVYESLDHLTEMGLAVKRVSKPARYTASSPEMVIDLLMDKHKKAADTALAILKELEQEKIPTDKDDALWTIYGDTNIEYKIRDLFGKAKKSISCVTGERFLPVVERCRISDIMVRMLVISDDPEVEDTLKKVFSGKNADVHRISREIFTTPPPYAPPEFAEMKKYLDCANVLELIVDDEELLMIPPFVSSGVSVLNTRNKGAILQMKMISIFNWSRFTGDPGMQSPVVGKPPKKAQKHR